MLAMRHNILAVGIIWDLLQIHQARYPQVQVSPATQLRENIDKIGRILGELSRDLFGRNDKQMPFAYQALS